MRIVTGILLLLLLPTQLLANVAPASDAQQQAEIDNLARQLSDYRTQRKAYERLTQLADNNQAAVIPMLELYRHKNADSGSTYETLRFINSFLQKYFANNKADPEVIEVMLGAIEHCAQNRSRWYGPLSGRLLYVSRNHVLSEAQLERMVAVAELYMDKVRKRQTTAYNATYIMKVVAQQGKYRALSPQAKSLAREFLESHNRQARMVGMQLFASQLYLNDTHSREIIYKLIRADKDRTLRIKALSELTDWLKTTSTPNADSRKLLSLYDDKKYTDIQRNLKHSYNQVIENPHLDTAIKAKFYDHITGIPGAGLDYLQLVNYAKSIDDRPLTDNEFKKILGVLAQHGDDKLGHRALGLVEHQRQQYGLSQVSHHELIFVAVQHSKLLSIRNFRDLVIKSVPYSYMSGENKPVYPQQVIIRLIDEIEAADNHLTWNLGLQLLSKMTSSDDLNRDAIDRLYRVFVNIDHDSIRSSVTHQYLYPYYRRTGYLQFDALANYVGSGNFSNNYLINQAYLAEVAKGRAGEPRQKLLAYYNDNNMPLQFRTSAVYQLAMLDFDYAQRHVLPVYAGANDSIVLGVWQQFRMVSQRANKKVDKQLLLNATQHHNENIRYLAWRMLEQHGVSTPFSVKWSRKSYRQDFYTGMIFFVGVPLSLILGSLLFLKGRKGRRVKYEWTKTAGVFIWLILTVIAILLGAAVLFLAGFSHSGTPHEWLDWGLGIIFGGYVLAALVTRLLIPTVPINNPQTDTAG